MTARTLHDYVSAAVRRAPAGEPFRLASGETSEVYVDMRAAMLADGRAICLAAKALHALLPREVESVGGVPTAGLLLLGPLLAECHASDPPGRPPRGGFYTRAEAKGHGLGARVEGNPRGVCCLVEDTVSTGGSIARHAAIAREAGCDVRYALALLDRGQGAREALAPQGIELLACMRLDEVA